jgi:lactoylglutathione lyase
VPHPIITVPDLDEGLNFFRDLLGFEVARTFAQDPNEIGPLLGIEGPDVRAAILTASDGTEIELMEFAHPTGQRQVQRRPEDAGLMTVTIIVDDLDAMLHRLTTGGYPDRGPIVSFAGSIRAAICMGPGGVPLLIGEHPA